MLKKLYILIAAVLLTSVILTGLIAYNVLIEQNRAINKARLQSAVNLVTVQLKNNQSYTRISELFDATFRTGQDKLRFTVIDLTGKVLYDNEADAATIENHLYRPEVNNAIKTKSSGFSVRRSSTLNQDIYYYAQYQEPLGLVIRTAIPAAAYLGGMRSMGMQIIIITGLAFIAMAMIGLFLTNRVTRPLIDLKKAAISMSDGHYDTKVKRKLNDKSEIGEVSLAFNKMADKIENSMNELADKNARLDTILNSMGNPIIAVNSKLEISFMNKSASDEFNDSSFEMTDKYPLISIVQNNEIEHIVYEAIKKRLRQQGEIFINTRKEVKLFRITASPVISAKSNGAIITFQDVTQIQKLQQLRADFVANVTHELKTPLTSIRGFVDTLRQGAIKNPDVSERFLEIIDVETERLHKLISDILSLSEIEGMKEDAETENFDLNSLIDEVAVLLDDEAANKKVAIITDIAGTGENGDQPPFMVKASKNRIKQILINLVENAVKYNVENGKVFISASRNDKNEVVLKVRDTGYGIPKEHIPRIFERFYRVDKSRSKDLGGTGLGLSIVKHIAMLYGGNASVESTIGQGSEFTVILKI